MQNLLDELKELFQQDDRLMAEGSLLKNKIIELALKLDGDLIKLLLSHPRLRRHFFADVEGVMVFDKEKFLQFVSNKAFLPDSYTAFSNKIGLTDDGGRTYLSRRREVALAWPYKDCVLEGGQTREDAKRNEVFWNTTLAPDDIDRLLDTKVLTNFRRIDADGEHPVAEIADSDNLIVKGNNLLALHSLLPRFRGRIKLIYIDPPYNTGGATDTFAYNNNFDHSTWLTFMKGRLEIAKHLLREDGFIAITIDHVELFYLGALADEIFGRENRVGLVTIVHNPKGRNLASFFSPNSEFMLVYANNINVAKFEQVAIDEDVKKTFDQQDEEGRYRWEPFMRARTVWSRAMRPKNWYPIYVSPDLQDVTLEKKEGYHEVFPITDNGQEMAWKNIQETFIELNTGDYFRARREKDKIRIYHKYREQQVLKNVWTDKKYQSEFHGTNVLKELLGENTFSYPKSVYAVQDTIKIMTSGNDIILDFFAGSGTTAHAVLDLNEEDGGNRRFILCEQMDYIEDVTERRVKKVIENNGSGDFISCELMEWNERYVRHIQDVASADALRVLWQEMQEKAFLSYRVDLSRFDEHAEEFAQLDLADQKRFLLEVLDKNQLYVNLSEIEDAGYQVSEQDKRLNRQFYQQG